MISEEETKQEAEKGTCSLCWFRHQGRCIHPDSPQSGYIIVDIPECDLVRHRRTECSKEESKRTQLSCICCRHWDGRGHAERGRCKRTGELMDWDEPACRAFSEVGGEYRSQQRFLRKVDAL